MFRFHFGQFLDLSSDLEDDGVRAEEEDDIVTPREKQGQENHPQNTCEEVSLDDLVCSSLAVLQLPIVFM